MQGLPGEAARLHPAQQQLGVRFRAAKGGQHPAGQGLLGDHIHVYIQLRHQLEDPAHPAAIRGQAVYGEHGAVFLDAKSRDRHILKGFIPFHDIGSFPQVFFQ